MFVGFSAFCSKITWQTLGCKHLVGVPFAASPLAARCLGAVLDFVVLSDDRILITLFRLHFKCVFPRPSQRILCKCLL